MTRKTNNITRDELTTAQQNHERRIAGLKADRTAAVLQGKSFDGALIRAAEDDLAATVDALAEYDRRARELAAAEAAAQVSLSVKERRRNARANIERLADERSQAIEEMEAATRAVASTLSKVNASRAALQVALYDEVGNIPVDLMASAQETRLSQALAAILAKVIGKPSFGEMRLAFGTRSADQPWLSAECYVADEVERILADMAEPEDMEGAR